MPEMFTVLPPAEALKVLFDHLPLEIREESIATAEALDRVLAGELTAPSSLPSFPRSTMDGYAVRAEDTFGATESLPAYLTLIGEVPMGHASALAVGPAQAAVVFTGGMIPPGADAVVMVERTQKLDAETIEVLRAVAPGENVIHVGEDIQEGEPLFAAGHILRPQDLGGLMALGITDVRVAARPHVAIVSTGDEVVPPEQEPGPGQVRDINTYTIAGLVARAGGVPEIKGIIKDDYSSLLSAARSALEAADALVISAGSSVSTRDLTSDVMNELGKPGVLVHGVAVRPGKPTILGVCNGKPTIGLPGNPVSAMVVAGLFLTPLLQRMQGLKNPPAQRRETARLAHNISSVPGREDYVQVRLVEREDQLWAEPVFGKSNLIYTMVKAEGMVCVPLDSNGLHQGEQVEVELF
ncbi:molybdopterin molybdochelatase [Syntrophus gentianae]|uniref:Molybdopterin molybdenumtransferase n=1 Tax=Syntrophus gentianae TaxID=43775 RepID=A0A1H8AUK7_9BACT|nr:gephyrin-like molybdotransferase Glp [Syntrophus gentianae]SEM74233.1 molybdopterin molybdochelatase [Syntrophus gentianae]